MALINEHMVLSLNTEAAGVIPHELCPFSRNGIGTTVYAPPDRESSTYAFRSVATNNVRNGSARTTHLRAAWMWHSVTNRTFTSPYLRSIAPAHSDAYEHHVVEFGTSGITNRP